MALQLLQVESGEKKDRLQAMLSLLVQLLFESRLVPSVALEIASEITICCNKAFGDLVELEVESPEDGEEPAFMDVLVDVLLSLLAQPSAPIRAAAEQVRCNALNLKPLYSQLLGDDSQMRMVKCLSSIFAT